ncbi:MAG: hypothetical protein ACLFUX_06110 [Spirochaetaceae bacterium]
MSGVEFLGRRLRGRFGFPSGVIATNGDVAAWMLSRIDALGFYVGKSTTIEPKRGNPEDILDQPTQQALWNAVGYANPGLAETVETFRKLAATVPRGVLLVPQIGESTAERFAYCARAFDVLDEPVGAVELNLSCPHADKAGILIGSDPVSVAEIVGAARKATRKALIVKLNAGVTDVAAVATAAVEAGADALSVVNTLGGVNPELANGYGGLSGRPLFSVLLETVALLRRTVDVPLMAMGGVASAADVRQIDELAPGAPIAVGSALAELDSETVVRFFDVLAADLEQGSDEARGTLEAKQALRYRPFVVRSRRMLGENLALLSFREPLLAEPGQFVFVKTAPDQAKPYSVAATGAEGAEVRDAGEDPASTPGVCGDTSDPAGLEILVRAVGPASRALATVSPGTVLRIRGPYGRAFAFPKDAEAVFVGAGCGIAPVLRAASNHNGSKRFALGTRSVAETAFLDRLKALGPVVHATEDGSSGLRGVASDALEQLLAEAPVSARTVFYNCGPEVVLAQVDEIERRFVAPSRILHVVERITACGIGICGKCATPEGLRVCVDGPVFPADRFTPMRYTRDKAGAIVDLGDGPKRCPSPNDVSGGSV